jgi:potassium efflux system protein
MTVLVTAGVALGWAVPAGAQPGAAASAPVLDAQVAEIEHNREAVASDAQVPAAVKESVAQLYDRALASLQAARATSARSAALASRIKSAPEGLAEMRERLAAPLPEPGPIQAGLPIEPLQEAVNQKQLDLRVARDALKERETALRAHEAASGTLSDEVAEAERRLREIATELDAPPAVGEAGAVSEARRSYLEARQAEEEAAVELKRQRLASYDVLTQLNSVERDLARRGVKRLESEMEALGAELQMRRTDEARVARAQAEVEKAAAATLPGPVAEIAKQTAELHKELEELTRQDNQASQRLLDAKTTLSGLESDLNAIRERVETVGGYGRVSRTRRTEISRATDRRIDVEELRRGFGDVTARTAAVLGAIEPGPDAIDETALGAKTEELLTTQLGALEELKGTYGRYLNNLTALDVAERQLIGEVQQTVGFIKQNLLWIPNLKPISPGDLALVPAALGILFSTSSWKTALHDAWRSIRESPAVSIAALLLLGAAFSWRSRARHKLAEVAEMTRRVRTDAFSHTVKAAFYTAVLAITWPLVIAAVGWHVRAFPVGAPFSAATGVGLMGVAALFFVVSLLRWTAHPDGLGNRHFRWPQRFREDLELRLRRFLWVVAPAVFLANFATRLGDPVTEVALGRPAIIVATGMIALLLWRLLNRSSPLMTHVFQAHPQGWLARLWYLWFSLLIASPLLLAVGSALGYQYTAVELRGLLLADTAYWLIGLLLLRDVLLRWVYVAERRLRFEAAVRRAEEARKHDGELPADGEVEVPEFDFRELGNQGRTVVQLGVFLGVVLSISSLWGDLLPAVTLFERVELPVTRIILVDGVQKTVPLTLADLGVAILVFVGTLLAARNLSGILQFTVLRRLRLEAGASYAIVTLCQYLVLAVGLVSTFGLLGFQWSKLQWLVAALSVGLGFGLQEIVANFVSGIILLLERPIRVGDTVTVGEAGGTVTRIQIRATTIMTWEKKELIVPNKEFITGRVLNWTLTEQQQRILLPVGIAYGSDVEKAMRLILEAAEENPDVLGEPQPSVHFEGFGDNALTLNLRAFVPNLDVRLTTQTAIHKAIYEKLNAAEIGIAFPQRDVHLLTTAPLDVTVHQNSARRPRADQGRSTGE